MDKGCVGDAGAGAELQGLLRQLVDLPACGQPDDLEAVGVAADDVEGLLADGAGATQDDDAFGRHGA